MTMKSIPVGMRPYERLEHCGAEALSDAELLAILIKSGTREKSALTLAEELLLKQGSLADVGSAGLAELRSSKGIGRVKAIQLLAAAEIGKRIAFGRRKSKIKITDHEYLSGMLMSEMKKLRQEIFQVLLFDKKWNYISSCRISAGTVDRTLVHPREVFYHAIQNLASAVVLAHNHPSGDCQPSKADYETTERIVKAGRIVGIDVADHMIVGNGKYYSMYREGDLLRIKEKMLNEGSEDYGT
ncbi:MAG: RadC family protein [Clostridia bacterium]